MGGAIAWRSSFPEPCFPVSFSTQFDALDARPTAPVERLAALLEPRSDAALAAMGAEARRVTRRNFGRTMRLFAPLYLSNECINNCAYCGFSRDNPVLRVTLGIDEVVAEARHLSEQGFRHILLVAGEHPRFVGEGYLEDCVRALREFVPSISIEVGPMETPQYEALVAAGCEGLVVYQETYDRAAYARLHTAGPKRDFDWRLDCPERGGDAGFRRVGIGALFGLSEWRREALRLALHLDFLQRHHWRTFYTVAFPRLRPAAGGFRPEHAFSDRELLQLICAFRLTFPEVGIVLSTREPAPLRDALATVGVTMMSAGSHTEPGGYTGQGRADLHLTVKGRRVDPESRPEDRQRAEGQFGVADERSAAEVAEMLRAQGLDPVWKDWDAAILTDAA